MSETRKVDNSQWTAVGARISIDDYLDGLSEERTQNVADFGIVRVIARSTDSCAARTVWKRLEDIHERGGKVMAVFAALHHSTHEIGALSHYAKVFGLKEATAGLRIAKLRRGQNIRDQVQLGFKGVWSQDDRKEPRSDLETDVICTAVDCAVMQAARLSFELIWNASHRLTSKEMEEIEARTRPFWQKK